MDLEPKVAGELQTLDDNKYSVNVLRSEMLDIKRDAELARRKQLKSHNSHKSTNTTGM